MAELNKITDNDLVGKGVIGQADVPGLSAEEMQGKVEEIVRSVAIKKINEIIDYLKENGATKDDLENIVVAAGAVTSVHGRMGSVVSEKGDYTAEQVGAAPEIHASNHFSGGSDPITPRDIGAAEKGHSHGNLSNDGKIGTVNGKILMTGVGGVVTAADTSSAPFSIKPTNVITTQTATFTVEDNREYLFGGITELNMVGAAVDCHGFIVFAGDITPTINISGFYASAGDDITSIGTTPSTGSVWEFSVSHPLNSSMGLIIWKNWSEE